MSLTPISNLESPAIWPEKIKAAIDYWHGPTALSTFGSARAALNAIATDLGLETLSDLRPASEQRSKINSLIDGLGIPAEASMYLDFRTGRSFGAVPNFSRPTGGSRFNAQRQLELVGNDVLRLDHDPVTGEPNGALLERAATNLWYTTLASRQLYKEPFVTRGYDLGIFEGNDSNPTNWHSGVGLFPEDVIATGTIVCRRGSWQHIMLGLTGATTSNNYNAAFDYDTGSFSYIGTQIDAFAISLGEELWRLGVRLKQPESNLSLRGLRIRASDGTNNQSVVLPSGETMIWGAPQVEVGPVATSYIPTGAAAADRAADLLTVPVQDGGRAFVFEFDFLDSPTASGGRYLAEFNSGTVNERISLIANQLGNFNADLGYGGSFAGGAPGTLPLYAGRNIGYAVASEGYLRKGLIGRGEVAARTDLGMPTGISNLGIGTRGISSASNANIRARRFMEILNPADPEEAFAKVRARAEEWAA